MRVDGDGVRVSTAHFAGGSSTPDLTTHYYTFASLSASFGGALETSGSSVKKYYSVVHPAGGGGGQTVAMKDADGFKYFLSDHPSTGSGRRLGSTSVVLDANGGILEQQRYPSTSSGWHLPFGGARTVSGSPVIASTDLTYTGQRNLPDTGLMDYRARFYSSALGRFIQPDTIIPGIGSQSFNRYSYVLNNPINASDPTGHKCVGEPDECLNAKGKPINGANKGWQNGGGDLSASNSPDQPDKISDTLEGNALLLYNAYIEMWKYKKGWWWDKPSVSIMVRQLPPII